MPDEKEYDPTAEETAEPENAPVIDPMAPAVAVEASKFVKEDTDRPVSDNTQKPDKPSGEPAQSQEAPQEGQKRRGRPKMTDEQKAAAKAARISKPPPSFSDLKGGTAPGVAKIEPPRNYQAEFLSCFIPASMLASKWLGDHWAVRIDQEKKMIQLTTQQEGLVNAGAQWFEYEKFGPMTPRLGFALALCAYAGVNMQIEPTPTKVKSAFKWLKDKWNKWRGKDGSKETDDRKKRQEIPQ